MILMNASARRLLACMILCAVVSIICPVFGQQPLDTGKADGPKIYVVGLRKNWRPSLYEVDLAEAKVTRRETLPVSGAAIGVCTDADGKSILVLLQQGTASNGSSAGRPVSIKLTLDTKTLKVSDRDAKQGYGDIEDYLPKAQAERISELGVLWRSGKLTKDQMPAVFWQDKRFLLLLTGLTKPDGELSLECVEAKSFAKKWELPLGRTSREVMPFYGPISATLVGQGRYLACVFGGTATLGHWAPGYVLVVDLEERKPNWVEIGSNPGKGVAHLGATSR